MRCDTPGSARRAPQLRVAQRAARQAPQQHQFPFAADQLERLIGRTASGVVRSEADWRLFPSLIRFEWVYRTLARCDTHSLADFPALLAYTRELYQWPGVAATLDAALTREAYFTSMKRLNPSGEVPPYRGVDFTLPHRRDNRIVADLQEKRGASNESSSPLSH
jgi:glutathionyl-hydroquinone reductase